MSSFLCNYLIFERVMSSKRVKLDNEKSYTKGPLDETFGQHAAFPVGEEGPSEVHEYLHKVRQEALNDRSFFYVERDSSSSKPMEVEDEVEDANESHIVINEKWKHNLLSRFMNLKETLTPDTITGDTSNIPVPQSASAWRTYVFQNPPPPIAYFFNSLDHPTVIKLVVYFTKWLSASTPETLSQWIFTVLLRLDKLLDSTETAIIRDFGKKARKLADKREKADRSVGQFTIDMVLVIVGEYYGQKDILM